MRDLISMTQLPSGTKWFQGLNGLKQQEEDEKEKKDVLKIPKEHDRDSSTSVNMSTSFGSFGISLRWFDDFFSISPTTRF